MADRLRPCMLPAPVDADMQRRVDQADMAEGLRQIAQQLSALRVHFLADQAQGAYVPEQTYEMVLSLVPSARQRQGHDKPEGAEDEASFLSRKTVRPVVPRHQS